MTTRLGVAALGLVALTLAGCGSGQPRSAVAANVARTAPTRAPAPASPPANVIQPATPTPEADPGLADLSPAQRRAYDLGYRDCSHGRYAPGNHLEAYRIGCGAAHDRAEAARPQG